MKTYYVGTFSAKERASGSAYENAFEETPRRTPAETVAEIKRRTAKAKAIVEQNFMRRYAK